MQNILIADNDRVFMEWLSRFLEKKGCRVVTAEDGLQALDALQTFSPDAVFVDLIMPNIDGKKLCRIIRGMEAFKSVYLVLLSAVSVEDWLDIKTLGADACIAKGPFDEMAEYITAVLEQPEAVARRCAAGEVLGVAGIYTRRISEELLSVKRHFETIVDQMSDGVLEINAGARIVAANSAVLAMLGLPEKQVLGAHLTELFTGEAHARIRGLVEESVQPGAAITMGHPLALNRYYLTIDVIISGVDAANRILILHDVTAIRQTENTFKRFNTELENRVRERTAELEAANRFKSEFVAQVSHEIRTPMNGVLGACDLALRENPPAKTREYLEMIHSSAINLMDLINDILDFSSIESGRIKFETHQFSLRETVERIYDVFHDMIQEKDLEFAVDLPREIPDQLLGDALRLRQVIINLLGNAFKFTESGEIVLRIRLAQHAGRELELVFSVADTGSGIEADKLDTLFDAFVQADGNRTRARRGTGLGLAISKKLVEYMGGAIWVQSMPGKGSTFSFTAHFGVAAETPAKQNEGRRRTDLVDLKALIIDDHDVARETLGMLVASFGCLVRMAATPHEALKICAAAIRQKDRIDLILLDHNMDEMNGVELAARISGLEWPVDAPVLVMISGYTASIDREAAAKAGIRKILSKPIKWSQLSDELVGLFVDEMPPPTKDVGAADAEGDFTGKRVLVVEDNPINQRVARALLQSVNFEVITACDGDEVLDVLEREPCDIVLMDVQMPRMDGYEATRLLRTRPGFKSLPVVAMTADATEEAMKKCMAAGMDDYVSKPIDRARLLALMKQFLEKDSN